MMTEMDEYLKFAYDCRLLGLSVEKIIKDAEMLRAFVQRQVATAQQPAQSPVACAEISVSAHDIAQQLRNATGQERPQINAQLAKQMADDLAWQSVRSGNALAQNYGNSVPT